jgi:hypothetical protein
MNRLKVCYKDGSSKIVKFKNTLNLYELGLVDDETKELLSPLALIEEDIIYLFHPNNVKTIEEL